MMKVFLDTADISVIRDAYSLAHFEGITTNPKIIAATEYKYGSPILDLKVIAKFLSERGSELHVEVVSTTYEGILDDAMAIRNELGEDVFVKIPVTRAGLAAIRVLSKEGYRITATCVYSFEEAMLAYSAGAEVAAVYYSRIARQGGDPDKVIALMRKAYPDRRLLVASVKNYEELEKAVMAGAEELTIAPSVYLLDEENKETLESANEFRKLWHDRLGRDSFV